MTFKDADQIVAETVVRMGEGTLGRRFLNRTFDAFDSIGFYSAGNYYQTLPSAMPLAGVGVSAGASPLGCRVAVRAWTESDWHSRHFEAIRKLSAEELDLRITGVVRVHSSLAAGNTGRCRPLKAGFSIGHHHLTAGTLGAFVRRVNDGRLVLLSASHVLVEGNASSNNDAILQPGLQDGGQMPDSRVGQLADFVHLKSRGNLVDAAIATIDEKVMPDDLAIPGIGPPAEASTADLPSIVQQKTPVRKVGRSTGLTSGSVSTIVRNFPVQYADGVIRRFDFVLEIAPTKGSFSQEGDSGSLVVDDENRAVGLLLAGDEDAKRSYINPIAYVQDLLHTRF